MSLCASEISNKHSVVVGTNMPQLRKAIRGMFREFKTLKVFEAHSSDAILKIINNELIEEEIFLIIDWDLPNASGIHTAREIRNNSKFENIPIIALMSQVSEQQIALACEIGINGCLLKPFAQKVLLEKYIHIIKSRANPPAHVKLIMEGKRFLNEGKHDEALVLFEKSKGLSDTARISVHIGEIHEKREDFDKAKDSFSKAIEKNPNYIKAFTGVANLLIKQNDYKAALPYLEKAISLSPGNADRHMLLGLTYLKLGNPGKADISFHEAVTLDLKNSIDVGKIYLQAGNLQKSEIFLRKHLNSNTDHRDTYNKLAIALKRQGLWQKAIDEYRKAIAKYPDDEVLYFNLGKAFMEGGMAGKAKESFMKAIKLCPEFDEAKSELIKLGEINT